MTRVGCVVVVSIWLVLPAVSAAQTPGRFELDVQVTDVRSSEFDAADVGVGGRIGWHPGPVVAVEGEVVRYPSNFAGAVPFSRARTEALVGVSAGPTFDRFRVFGRVSPGFLRFHEAPAPIACILIFPPPLACTLASGQTLFAIMVGGGAELYPTRRAFLRVDVGDRLVRYPGPAFDSRRTVREDDFFDHDFRVGVGAGVRF